MSAGPGPGPGPGAGPGPEPPELIGGPERRSIVLVPYDPGWPDAFARERARVVGALGGRARRVDHIGSTAVAGLSAKPVVDVGLGVDDPDDESAYLADLLAAGYELRVREPGHRMVRTPDRGVHVHVWTAGGDRERRHLLFRDHLRAHGPDREAYAALKHDLVRHEWPTMNHYAEAKGALIAEITDRAWSWARETGWEPDAGDRAAAVREQLLGRERLLLHPGPSTDVAALLDDGFLEVGASGRRWDRAAAIELVEARRDTGVGDHAFTEVDCRDLGAGVHLLTFALRTGTGPTRRASIWRETGGGWRMLHHQGTPVRD